MNLETYIEYWKKLLALIPFNIFDYVMFVIFAIYVFEDASFGLLASGIGFFSTVLSFFVGLALYHPVSQFLVSQFALAKGFADAVAFFIVTLFSFTFISVILTVVRRKYITVTFPKRVNVFGGAFFGSLSFFFIASFAVALLLSFPIANPVKNAIRDSVAGKFLSVQTQGFEGYVRQIFGGAIEETINFMTVKTDSDKTVKLNFRTTSHKVDPGAESAMIALLNRERAKMGLSELTPDRALTLVARDHAEDMVERGYFSHYTPEGFSPFDRMERHNIYYTYAGENLALAPDVNIAMDGLMKSPGHRANILSDKFEKVGVGVIDAGIYGEMFVQEFSD